LLEVGHGGNDFFSHQVGWSNLMHPRQGHNEVLNPRIGKAAATLNGLGRSSAAGSKIKRADGSSF
jgi:hypothetical protein